MAIYMWKNIAPWIYWSSALGLISMVDNTNIITIADKNLWATTVYNYGDTLTIQNTWNMYQQWNNYWFPSTLNSSASISSSTTKVNAQNYWPWNYYSSSTFIKNSVWESSGNRNLRWWVTWTVEAMKWPCNSWFHIPSYTEWGNVINIWETFWIWSSSNTTPFLTYLKIPLAWQRDSAMNVVFVNQRAYLMSSSFSDSVWFSYYTFVIPNSILSSWAQTWIGNINWQIRPFANTPAQPDDTRTVLYQPN